MRTQIIIFAILILTSLSFAQIESTSLLIPVDPKSVSMGEGFVAVNSPLSSLMYNPASYNANSGLNASFSERRANYFAGLEQLKYFNFSASYNSPIGEFGFMYNRFDEGDMTITYDDPTPQGKINVYDHLFLVKYSRPFGDHVTAGVAIKVFNELETQTQGNPISLVTTSAVPVVFDLGTMYSLALFPSLESVIDNLTVGVSLQNIGTDFRQKSGSSPEEVYVRIPHYVRVGFSYSLKTPSGSTTSPSVLNVLLNGEYRNELNAFDLSERDTWGFGAELTGYEVVSLRIGSIVMPYTSVYGNKGVPSLRYGAGINFPFHYIGVDTPLRLHVDYAGIPTNSQVYRFFYIGPNTTPVLHVLSVGVEYPLNSSH